jgi:hypothetical protein
MDINLEVNTELIENIINLACQGYYGEAYEEILGIESFFAGMWKNYILGLLSEINIFGIEKE